jgi:hypothetical protein
MAPEECRDPTVENGPGTADFRIGESGNWFFALMWEHGKDGDPEEA